MYLKLVVGPIYAAELYTLGKKKKAVLRDSVFLFNATSDRK